MDVTAISDLLGDEADSLLNHSCQNWKTVQKVRKSDAFLKA